MNARITFHSSLWNIVGPVGIVGLAGLVGAGLCACANGLIDDAPPADGGTRTVEPNSPLPMPMPPRADAASDDANEQSDASVDASNGAVSDAAADAAPVTPVVVVQPPVLDGTIQPGEYGTHADGQNQQAFMPGPSSTTWYMTWTETNLYVAVSAANVAEGVVIYIDSAPRSPSNSGTNADGSLAGALYDNGKVATLPFRADFVAYIKSGYNEYRIADGANGWSAQTVGAITMQGNGASRELTIPWSTIHAGGRPSAFAWLGYASSATGYAYGTMPPANPAGNLGQSGSFGFFYSVNDATPGTGTKPFALQSSP
jgi:hypothetical protein